MGGRTCIIDLARMLNLGPTTVWRLIKRKIIKPHSSPLHPGISEACKMARIRWALRLIMDYTIPQEPTYNNMYDFIHIDEKWFYLTKKNQRVYLANNEPYPHRSATKRTSKNRVKGIIETKPVKSVNQIETRAMMINKLLPAIKAKCHHMKGKRSIQSLMHKKMPEIVEDLSGVVYDSFNELHPKTLSNVWMTLQFVSNEILKHKGNNDYQLPHNKKKILEDEGILPEQVKAPIWAVNECMQLYDEWKANQ
ncbi:uncharacterized protein [Spinacia oleracea]|uniref:Transposase Tc1-like domain-containing protein n=1 Tax=Spinacia oleracea TaxID=3562 RepID=A0ABM3QPY6_SPIOL|nr:uncharacterized protein LOC110804256 [Spinacia oleracea]